MKCFLSSLLLCLSCGRDRLLTLLDVHYLTLRQTALPWVSFCWRTSINSISLFFCIYGAMRKLLWNSLQSVTVPRGFAYQRPHMFSCSKTTSYLRPHVSTRTYVGTALLNTLHVCVCVHLSLPHLNQQWISVTTMTDRPVTTVRHLDTYTCLYHSWVNDINSLIWWRLIMTYPVTCLNLT